MKKRREKEPYCLVNANLPDNTMHPPSIKGFQPDTHPDQLEHSPWLVLSGPVTFGKMHCLSPFLMVESHIMSDGTRETFFFNPATCSKIREITVTDNSLPKIMLNDWNMSLESSMPMCGEPIPLQSFIPKQKITFYLSNVVNALICYP